MCSRIRHIYLYIKITCILNISCALFSKLLWVMQTTYNSFISFTLKKLYSINPKGALINQIENNLFYEYYDIYVLSFYQKLFFLCKNANTHGQIKIDIIFFILLLISFFLLFLFDKIYTSFK